MDLIKKYLTEGNKVSNQEAGEAINKEGIGHAIQHYINWKEIEDKKIAKLWKQASDAMTQIEKILKEYID